MGESPTHRRPGYGREVGSRAFPTTVGEDLTGRPSSGSATDRPGASPTHSADGSRWMGRATDPRRVAKDRVRDLRDHGVSLYAAPTSRPGYGREVESRTVPTTLGEDLAVRASSGSATDRPRASPTHPAGGSRWMGRAPDSRRVVEARVRDLRDHGVSLYAAPTSRTGQGETVDCVLA